MANKKVYLVNYEEVNYEFLESSSTTEVFTSKKDAEERLEELRVAEGYMGYDLEETRDEESETHNLDYFYRNPEEETKSYFHSHLTISLEPAELKGSFDSFLSDDDILHRELVNWLSCNGETEKKLRERFSVTTPDEYEHLVEKIVKEMSNDNYFYSDYDNAVADVIRDNRTISSLENAKQ